MIKFRAARIALTGATASQLTVDAAGLMACGTNDLKPAELCNAFAASLISVPRPAMFVATVIAPFTACHRNDLGFFRMILRIQRPYAQAYSASGCGIIFSETVHRLGSDQDRTPFSVDYPGPLSMSALYFSRSVM
jgi:hypothetical protein